MKSSLSPKKTGCITPAVEGGGWGTTSQSGRDRPGLGRYPICWLISGMENCNPEQTVHSDPK